MYDCRENEHQELFHLDIDPSKPLHIHIPSPLGKLGYYVYVRVPAHAVAAIRDVSVELEVGGLHEEHVVIGPDAVRKSSPSKLGESAWVCLGKAMVSRGGGTVRFSNWPEDVKVVDVLLCTWKRFVESGLVDDWILAQKDALWAASGVPLGGIGCGRVDICRDGRFRNFSMNNNQDAPIENPAGLPNAYLAMAQDGVITEIASSPIVEGHQSCGSLEYNPRFPQATLSAKSIFPGIDAQVVLSGPLTPHDLKRSSLPGLVLRWELKNANSADASVRCSMGWPNLIGIGGGVATAESGIGYGDGYYHHWDDSAGRDENRVEFDSCVGVRFTGKPEADHIAASGEHILAVSTSGCKAGSSCGGGAGEVFADVTIPAGGTAQVTMALVAAMPHWVDSLEKDRGHLWQNHYANGQAIVQEILASADDIIAAGGALAAHLDDSSLPSWLRRRLSNCNYPLVTNSVLYKDGRFSVNEGPTEMAGCYGTIDQRLAAHPATQLLFPELNKRELGLFSDIQGKNGGICHDLGSGHLEREPGEMAWPDLTCSYVIQTARHAWSTGDSELEDSVYPRARQAIIRHSLWAEQGNGVAQVGTGLGTSYDGYHYFGTTGYMATLWIAALGVCEKWAAKRGDNELLDSIAKWRTEAVSRLDADLWNGSHYIAYGSGNGNRRETCHAGQLAGQVFARLLCGQNVLDESRVKQCVDSILRLNCDPGFAVPPDEVSPDGKAATEFGWLPYVEGFMLTAIGSTGDQRLWPVWERMIDAVDNDGASPCDTRLMYLPSGEPSWGWCYMTAPASWLVYDSIMDFFFTANDGALRLRTTMPGRFPIVHPLFWATADISENGEVTFTIKKSFAQNPVSISSIESAASVGQILVDGKPLTACSKNGDYRVCALPQPVPITEGATLKWQVK